MAKRAASKAAPRCGSCDRDHHRRLAELDRAGAVQQGDPADGGPLGPEAVDDGSHPLDGGAFVGLVLEVVHTGPAR